MTGRSRRRRPRQGIRGLERSRSDSSSASAPQQRRRSKARCPDPEDLLDEAVERAGKRWVMSLIDDDVAVDTVLRFERLREGLDRSVAELGVAPRVGLPGAKTGVRPPRTPAHEVLSPVQARRVAWLARREIETFGYEWSGPDPL